MPRKKLFRSRRQVVTSSIDALVCDRPPIFQTDTYSADLVEMILSVTWCEYGMKPESGDSLCRFLAAGIRLIF
ncbi:hypothetical protein D3C80_2029210 [compost metagenome]